MNSTRTEEVFLSYCVECGTVLLEHARRYGDLREARDVLADQAVQRRLAPVPESPRVTTHCFSTEVPV